MPLTTDMTTINVVVAMTTPSNVRKDRSLWLRSASSAIQKASRAVTQMVAPRAPRGGCGMVVTVPPRCLGASCLPCLSLHEVIIPWSEYAIAGVSVPRRPPVLEKSGCPLEQARQGIACQWLSMGDNLWRMKWQDRRSEEHTSELQSLRHLVCRLLLEKKKYRFVLYVPLAQAPAPITAVLLRTASDPTLFF